MRTYPNYRQADSQWLDTVPAHWRFSRIEHVATARTSTVDKHSVEGQPRVRLCNYTDVYKNDSIHPDIEFMEATAKPEQVERFRLAQGDTVITKDSETADDIGVPAFVQYEAPDLVCGYHLAIMRPDREVLDPRYLYWALASQPTLRQWEVVASGVTRVGIRGADLSKARLPVPPLGEQQAIADYLDRETAQIDTLIEEQQHLIDMLRERRQSVIETAVGRGLSGEVSYKSSGLFWTDSVPQHWVVANIRRFATMKSGHTPSRSNPEYWVNCHVPWFTLSDVWQLRDGKQIYLGETANQISDTGLANSAAELLPAGTVVLSRTASVGFSGVMPCDMATSQDFWNWVPGPDLDGRFLMWVFRAMRREFDSLMIGSTHKTIYQATAGAIRIPVPPLDEQRSIAEYVHRQTTKIDTTIAETERFIELSRERRSALIAAAVTGQIDVRDVAAR